ncbi:glycosyltransferase family 2 protein [Candidatus Woesebacteria bacterium]|nr:glycosyltransferase family 2 protein [Candidatus Woesebacteria bacterium]
MSDISIVIVSTNIKDLLKECLESVSAALKGIDGELIVVDNASSDGTPDMVAKEFSWVKLIRKKENHGFGENNNFGMRVAKGKYVLLLRVASCALLNPDQKTYQGSGGYFPTLIRVFAWMSFLDDIPGIDTLIKPYHPLHGWSPFYKGEGYFKKPHKQDWVTGAYYLMRKEAMDEVGLFDEDFFLYVEEVDLSYRFAKAGWETWYLPKWKIIHYGQVTIGSERAMVYELKNLKLFYKKHYPAWQLPILTLILKLGVALRTVLYGLVGKFNVSKIYVKAFKTI